MKTLHALKTGADVVGVLLFLLTFLGFVVQVFWRYVLDTPLPWTGEVVLIAFVWSVFWATAFMVPLREHVTFDVVHDMVGERTRRVFGVISMLALLIAFAILIPYTWDYLEFLTRKKSPVLRLPMQYVFACYMLFVVAIVVQAGWRLGELLLPGRFRRD